MAQGFARLPTFIVNWQKIDQNYFILTTYNSIDYIIFFKKKKELKRNIILEKYVHAAQAQPNGTHMSTTENFLYNFRL